MRSGQMTSTLRGAQGTALRCGVVLKYLMYTPLSGRLHPPMVIPGLKRTFGATCVLSLTGINEEADAQDQEGCDKPHHK